MAPASSPSQLPEVPQKELPDLSSDGRLNSADMKSKRNTISEMKRINALNLEPTLPKPDDSQKARISVKETQLRGPGRSSDLKQEFQNSLSTIKTQQASKDRKQRGEAAGAASSDAKPSGFAAPTFNPPPKGGFNSSLSPKAAEFNPQAAEFKPKPAGAIQAPAPAAAPTGPSPPFNVEKKPASDRSLLAIIEPFFTRAKDSAPNSTDPQWPDAKGPSYREVLAVGKGAAGANAVPPMMPGRGAAGAAPPNAWQQPQGMQQPGGQQTAPGGPGHPQQGFVMGGPGGGPNGAQMQMYPQQGGYPGQQDAAQGAGQGQGQQQQQQQPQMAMMPMQGMQGMMPQGGMPGQQMMMMPMQGMQGMQGGPQGGPQMMMMPMQGNQGGQHGQQQQQMMMMPMMMGPNGQQMMMAPGQMMPQNMQGQMGMQQPMQNQGAG